MHAAGKEPSLAQNKGPAIYSYTKNHPQLHCQLLIVNTIMCHAVVLKGQSSKVYSTGEERGRARKLLLISLK